MAAQTTATGTIVVDADAHVIEPPDLWSSRLPGKWREAGPVVEVHPDTGNHHWRIGDHWTWPVGHWGQAGYSEYPPIQPRELEEIDPAGYDPRARLQRMDEHGVDVEILYPNLVGFLAPLFTELDSDMSIACIRVYNDFVAEWVSADPQRLIPIAMLPYWDREESVREMARSVEMGHRGVLFANKFERIGLPNFCDPYWDPIYAAAQEMDVPVNYHIGFSTAEIVEYTTPDAIARRRVAGRQARLERAKASASMTVRLVDEIGQIITSGLCERFPRVKLVSVESAFGYVPFYLEALDWAWRTGGAVHPGEMLPSEYFARQCYGTLWFERTTLPLLDRYPDNFMFSTDFPHPTSLSPGPASPADVPSIHIRESYGSLDETVRAKVLGLNALSVYGIRPPNGAEDR